MLLQGVAQLGKEPRVSEPEGVQVSLASIQALPDPGEDLSRIAALDEIREVRGKGIELFHERRPPLILVHGPKVTSESTATASRFASASPTPHLVPAPNSAAGVLGKRSGEALLLGDLVGPLLGHTEELGDLDEADCTWLGHRSGEWHQEWHQVRASSNRSIESFR
jgi:hypothetical protein